MIKIIGDSGKEYNISFSGGRYICSCPDFQYRHKKSGECKHIVKYLGTNPMYKPRAYFEETIKNIEYILRKFEIEIVGSYRREAKIMKDIDILIQMWQQDIMPHDIISKYLDIKSRGQSRVIGTLDGIQIDFRMVYFENQWPSMLMHTTGSKIENIRLRKKAIKLGMKLNEYGLFTKTERLKLKTEEDYYWTLEETYLLPRER